MDTTTIREQSGLEKDYLKKALEYYTEANEEEVLKIEKSSSKNFLFATGFFTSIKRDILIKLELDR